MPNARKDATVINVHAAELQAKECHAEAKTRRAIDDNDEEPATAIEQQPTAPVEEAEYEYWALSATTSDDEPEMWKQAQNSPFAEEWRKAYQAELDSIKLHGVYELVPRESVPLGCKVIRSRPVFKIKCESDGEMVKFKARLVFMGYAQVAGLDYCETYAPKSRFESF